ncbi:LytR/AlgR family response regulator transcription factor [Flagellimonas oceanensis]|uniref:LytR/AlgR family response regulator transcription factor n=1 Tax=Flagellimonas oceanensis TaxID=2499163 RepID=UPI003BA853F9
MSLFKTVIIDDEPLAIDVIGHYLERFPDFELVGSFTDSVEAFNYLKEGHRVDLAFTDIAMPDISGIELVKLSKGPTKFIMTTSYSEYAVESFDLEVVDYLMKPIAFERFAKALERFEKSSRANNVEKLTPSLFVKDGEEYIKIRIDDIDYIQGLKDYAKIVTGNNHCLALKTLKSIEDGLRAYDFMRIHKSYIVPLNKIVQYNGKRVLINNVEVPVGSSYRDRLKQFIQDNGF